MSAWTVSYTHLDVYKRQVENNKVENRATGIVMNVKTGEIVAMAVKGDYDPNNPFVIADEQERARIAELPEEEQQAATSAALQAQWRNKAVSDTYYPGSVFKLSLIHI